MGKNFLIEICSLFTKANFSRSPRKYFVFILFLPSVVGSTHYVWIEKIYTLSRPFWKYIRILHAFIYYYHTRTYTFLYHFIFLLYYTRLSAYSQGGTLRKLRRIFFVLLRRYFFSSMRKNSLLVPWT